MAEPTIGSPLSMHDPRTVGPWTIHSRLGAGGMGVVFYATQGSDAAAIKVIRPGLLDAPATRDRFRREVGILASVQDMHICRSLGADLESEPAWLALEYLSGPVLRDEVAANGPLAEEDWWELARGLAQALAVLELHRVTHRDLKPGNVILNERGPVLIDFGIAHPEDATSLTATGLVTGSPAWLSPEQANLEPTGPATDIFTLGSLLAFAATGKPPFGEGASVAVLMSIIKKDPDLTGIDPNRAALLRRMLAKDPAQRPSAREVLELARAGETGQDVGALLGIGALGAATATPDATIVEAPSPAVVPPPVVAAPVAGALGVGSPVLAHDTAPDAGVGGSAAGSALADQLAWEQSGVAPTAPPAEPWSSSAPRTTGPRGPGPRTTAAQRRRSNRRRGIAALVAIAAIALVGWLLLTNLGDGVGAPDGNSSSESGPPSAGDAPPAPSDSVIVSGDWVLETWRMDNNSDGLVVSGTVRNRGDAAASADLLVWAYAAGESIGSVSGTVSDVAAGDTVLVNLSGDAVWKPGEKSVIFEATPR